MELNFVNDVKKSHKSCCKYDGVKKYIDTGNVNGSNIVGFEEYSYDKKPSRANVCVCAGDVLVAKMKNSIKVLLIDKENEDYIYSTGFYAFRDSRILPEYLKYYFLSPCFNHEKDIRCIGGTQKAINDNGMKKININVPSIDEQKAIVETLNLIAALIDNCRSRIESYNELIISKFVEMFGDPVFNTKSLPELLLPELGEFQRGVSQHRPRDDPALLGGKYPLIQTGDVANTGLYITEYKSTYSELGLSQSKMWHAGTLCITIAANIAKTAILTFDACFPDSVVGFVSNNKTNNVFIHYWFSFLQKIIEAQASETAQKNINLKTLNNLSVIVPPINEQNKFVEFVLDVQNLIDEVKSNKLYYEELLINEMVKCFSLNR